MANVTASRRKQRKADARQLATLLAVHAKSRLRRGERLPASKNRWRSRLLVFAVVVLLAILWGLWWELH